jgi:hypothetical protein
MSAFYAEDFDREFCLGLIIGGPLDSQPLWLSDRWSEWINSLERLIDSARGAAAVEGCVIRNWDGPPSMKNFVGFSSKEWRQPPPNDGVFGSWALLAPSNEKCARERRCPDVYAAMSNLRKARQSIAKAHACVVLAIGADLPVADQLLDDVMLNIAASIPAMMTAKTRRPWGFATGVGYNKGISEAQWLNGGLLSHELTPGVLSEKWEHVEIMGERKPE